MHFYHCFSVPVPDSVAVVAAFRSQRELLFNLARHCLLQLANNLYSAFVIPEQVKELAFNTSKDVSERVVAVLDCVESRLEVVPADLDKIHHILRAEPFFDPIDLKRKLIF